MKIETHPGCPLLGYHSFGSGRRSRYGTDTRTLYIREAKTRTMKPVGVLCLRCGAVKREGWPGWVTTGPAERFPPAPPRAGRPSAPGTH